MWGYGYRPYVPVAKRRANALVEMNKLSKKKGVNVQPVRVEGRTIARTFWGKAWCEHLEKFSDYENRLPRGRTYVRNGSVCHLEIQKGKIVAKVSGSELYDIEVKIKTLPEAKWKNLKARCAGGVGSLLELLQGKMSNEVMTLVTDRDNGLFPLPSEIDLDCSCPDWADMCKHVAAALYGIGARLDEKPELLFHLRGVDHTELIGVETAAAVVAKTPAKSKRTLEVDSIADVFGIDLAKDEAKPVKPPKPGAKKVATPRSIPKKPLPVKKGKSSKAKVRGKGKS
ncbi:MAG: SWIM zinc finger family protein [Planctomycetota bacterium]